eukprot:17198-Heterococcus_DN1.PRE.1
MRPTKTRQTQCNSRKRFATPLTILRVITAAMCEALANVVQYHYCTLISSSTQHTTSSTNTSRDVVLHQCTLYVAGGAAVMRCA